MVVYDFMGVYVLVIATTVVGRKNCIGVVRLPIDIHDVTHPGQVSRLEMLVILPATP